MRLYGKRFLTNRTEIRIADRKETRDALVYDINEAQRWCRVRVAGTDILVRAWFPANFMRAPDWLKINCAVRITHVGGSKSRIEVVSPGLVQPTAMMSPISGGADTIVLGMNLSAPIEGDGWTITIGTGSYRINGVGYLFVAGGPPMDNGGWHMGEGGDMAGDYWMGTVDPISAHDAGELWFRYDAFIIGTDGQIHYLKGDEWEFTGHDIGGGESTGPEYPDIPLNHVLIREYILVYSGTTSITTANIGKVYEAPYPDTLSTDYQYSEPFYEANEDEYARERPGIGVVYGGHNTYVPAGEDLPNRGSLHQDMQAGATVSVLDQYGNPYSWWSSGSVNQLGISFIGLASYDGYGAVTTGLGDPVPDLLDDTGNPGPEVVVSLGLGYQYSFSYTRKHTVIDQPDPEAAGYPNYEQADDDSHTATLRVRLISAETKHPVEVWLTFWNLYADGKPQ